MAKRIPSLVGDVLILRTTQSFAVHVVGRVSHDGQQDFSSETDVHYADDYAKAVARARALVLPGGRIYFRDIDSGDWHEITT